MARPPVPTEPTPHTKAWMTLDQNLTIISHMLDFVAREIAAIKPLSGRLNKTSKRPSTSGLPKGPERAKLVRSLKRYSVTLGLQLARRDTATLWQVVMLVTCVEAYLQDVLVDAATVDAEFMSKSEQVAAYADVLAATSLDELAIEMRRRWARGWLSDGGPTRWMPVSPEWKRKTIRSSLPPRLELIWGIRHVTVHAAGVATADFLKRHPGAAKAVGDRVRVSLPQFNVYLAAALEFLETTERFFLARCPSLRA